MKIYFFHASEDKAIVDEVFKRMTSKYPDIEGWLDKYEIIGGDELIDKIIVTLKNEMIKKKN